MADDPSRRQLAKRERRNAGDRSADLARKLLQMKDATLAKITLDEELREVIDEARAIGSQTARRRAERALAGELRKYDLVEIAASVANVETSGAVETQQFHIAEQWRTQLIDDDAALAEFPGDAAELPTLVTNARRERDTGQPAGAKRALFRHIVSALAKAKALRDLHDDT
jgi:ribosome-associated protein